MASMGFALNIPLWTFLLLTSSCLLIPVNSQFQRTPEDSGCGAGTTCVLITQCPRLLDILKQVKNGMGGAAAKREIFSNHCGFKDSLPLVCCEVAITESRLVVEATEQAPTMTSTTKEEIEESKIE